VVGARRGKSVIYSLYDDHVGVLLAEAVAHTEHLRARLRPETELRAVSR
jgi:hypothetical protein